MNSKRDRSLLTEVIHRQTQENYWVNMEFQVNMELRLITPSSASSAEANAQRRTGQLMQIKNKKDH